MAELSGRSALITGAGQNVGTETARRLATSGAYVGVTDVVADRAEAVVEEIRSAGGEADAVVADVTDLDAVTDAFGRFGSVDILVNNAGIPLSGFGMKVLWQADPTAWKPFVDLNVFGPINCTYTVLGGIVERGWGRVMAWRPWRSAMVMNMSSPRSVRCTSIDAAMAMTSPPKE